MDQINKKILIVEDDKDFLWLLKQGFIGQNFSVVDALNGEDGMDVAEKENPDLIIMDIQLPKMDGITVAQKLREKGSTAPVIFLTNLTDPEHISKAMELSRDTEYILKADMRIDQVVARAKEKLGLK